MATTRKLVGKHPAIKAIARKAPKKTAKKNAIRRTGTKAGKSVRNFKVVKKAKRRWKFGNKYFI